MRYYANSADPVQTSENVASNQGQHCLFTAISMQNTIKMKSPACEPKIHSHISVTVWEGKRSNDTDSVSLEEWLNPYISNITVIPWRRKDIKLLQDKIAYLTGMVELTN